MVELTGKTYDIQGFSVQDGPGIRTTVFLKGCPLRCPWCHSPESQRFETEANFMRMRCLGVEACGLCIPACTRGAIFAGEPSTDASGNPVVYPDFDKSKCDECGLCAEACNANALYMCGTDWDVDSILKRVLRDRPFYEQSGGGVTVSGGECLSQPEFTIELLRRLKEEGIHTAVDTTGFARWEFIQRAMAYTDLFLYDLKNMDSTAHKAVIGVPNELIVENCVKIAKAGGKMWVRIPVIPMFNSSREDFEAYGAFLSEMKEAVEVVQLLPYHKMGVSKYDRLMRHDTVFVADVPTDALMERRKEQLEAYGLTVRIH